MNPDSTERFDGNPTRDDAKETPEQIDRKKLAAVSAKIGEDPNGHEFWERLEELVKSGEVYIYPEGGGKEIIYFVRSSVKYGSGVTDNRIAERTRHGVKKAVVYNEQGHPGARVSIDKGRVTSQTNYSYTYWPDGAMKERTSTGDMYIEVDGENTQVDETVRFDESGRKVFFENRVAGKTQVLRRGKIVYGEGDSADKVIERKDQRFNPDGTEIS
jgi:hypothetical protein